jgi:hypothetical protein
MTLKNIFIVSFYMAGWKITPIQINHFKSEPKQFLFVF